MQIDQLTLLLGEAASLGQPGSNSQSPSGRPVADFGAFLLSLLSMDSLPFAGEPAAGDEAAPARVYTIEDNAKPQPPLPGAVLQAEGSTGFPFTVDRLHLNNNRIINNTFINPGPGAGGETLPNRIPNLGTDIDSVTDNAAISDNLYSVDEQAGTHSSNGAVAADFGTETPFLPVESIATGSGFRIDHPLMIDPTVLSEVRLDMAVETAELSEPQKMNFMQHGHEGQRLAVFTNGGQSANNFPSVDPGLAAPAQPALAVDPGSDDSVSNPELLTRSNVRTFAAAPVAGDTVRLSGLEPRTQTQRLETLFPGTKIESLSVSPEKPINPEAVQTSDQTERLNPDSPPAPNRPITPVSEKPLPEQKQTAVGFDKKSTGERVTAANKEAVTFGAELKRPESMAIKTESLSIPKEIEARPAVSHGNLDSSVSPTGKTESATPETARQVRFSIEPESLRSPLKPPAEIRLRLQPEELGVVKLNLRVVDHHLTARAVVQSPAARLAIEGNLAHLQRTMADAGLVIERFEVTVGHTPSISPTHPDTNGQKRRHSFRPKTNRRYQAVAGVQQTAVSHSAPAGWITAGTNPYRLNMVA